MRKLEWLSIILMLIAAWYLMVVAVDSLLLEGSLGFQRILTELMP